MASVGQRTEGRRRELFDDGDEVVVAVGGERSEVRVGVGEQPSRDRDGDVAGEALVAQLCVHEGTAVSSVSIGERMDGLELGVGDGGLGQNRYVVAIDEREQVVDRTRDVVVARRDEQRVVRAVIAPTDPHWFLTPTAGDFRPGLDEQGRMHRSDCVSIETFGECDGSGHCPLVGNDEGGVVARMAVEFGFGNGAGGNRQVLDLGGCCRFRAGGPVLSRSSRSRKRSRM